MTPSYVERLKQILHLEQTQGFQDRAVLGGLAGLLENWRTLTKPGDEAVPAGRLHSISEVLQGYRSMTATERCRVVERALVLLDHPAHPGGPPPGENPGAAGVGAEPGAGPARRRTTPPRQLLDATPRLADPVTKLKGIGTAGSGRLSVLGIRTVRDLIYHFPRRYDDFGQRKHIKQLELGDQVTVTGTVRSTHLGRAGGRSIFSATLKDDSGAIECNWFNQPYLDRSLAPGQQIAVSGQVTEYRGRLMFSAPEWEPLRPDLLHTGRVVPIYPLTEGLYARTLRRLIHDALDGSIAQIVDPLPLETQVDVGLIDLPRALRQIHFPASMDEAQRARERLCFDELLLLQLGVLRKRREWQRERSAAIQVPSDVVSSFAASLPFDLTGAQRRATQEILHDMAQAVPMSRLLQGDVGSGKTVVAVAAMLAAVRAGYQAALMAPTSILAQQHADTVAHMLEGVPDVQVALLEGSQSALAKSTTRERLARGEIDIAIGTHALIQEGVTFPRLGLVVVDEQHRFGVAQRQTLRDKNATFRPHMLAMSATPIPRTLALTIYGDLEVSVLDELPPHRKPVVTAVRSQSSRESVYGFVRTQLEQGHQAYIICPLVQESPQIDARAAVEEHERLSRDVFSQFRLGLLHGRVGAEEKETVMRRFKDGQYDILVSTAVVEVGVDVPNATVMLIEGAERFGLAQLHQFRGRVGRGDARAYCILLSDNTTEENMARLQIMADTNDGFVLAEKDLELRGPGDFLGVRQHGLPELKVAQLSDRGTLELARREALRIFEKDPELRSVEHRALAEQVESFWGTVSDA
jgi:ATP-dependent DNA helicase RecG